MSSTRCHTTTIWSGAGFGALAHAPRSATASAPTMQRFMRWMETRMRLARLIGPWTEAARDGRRGGAVSFARPCARGAIVAARQIAAERADRHAQAFAEGREALVRVGRLAELPHMRYRDHGDLGAIAPRMIGDPGDQRFGHPPC